MTTVDERPASEAKWVNVEEDAGALHALLLRLPEHLPVEALDTLWLFPTRRAGSVESTVVVAAAFTEEAARRRVHTAHFKVTRNKRGEGKVEERLAEHALAPVDALGRVVDGVVRRLGDDVGDAPPREVELGGQPERWAALIEELGGQVLAPPAEEEAAAEEAMAGGDAAGPEAVPTASPAAEDGPDGAQADPAG